MAQRLLYKGTKSFERGPVNIYAHVAVEGGAPRLVHGKGVASVTDAGTGKVGVVLQDQFNKLLSVSVTPHGGVASVFNASTLYTPSVDGYLDAAGEKTITVVTTSGGSIADLDGYGFWIHAVVDNSSGE